MKVKFISKIVGITVGLVLTATAAQATVLMSQEWGQQACDAWNANAELTDGLVTSGWVDNNNDRGHKIMHVYRTDCENSPQVEMVISKQDGKAMCTYGGAVEKEVDTSVDYIMNATTRRWLEMGAGEYGPMKGMMFGRLKFKGPKWEAMKNMGPFENFLLLVGVVPSTSDSCP